jgi:hypothetical protein
MLKHKHAELMAEYAKDAMETDRPWERWEVKVYRIDSGYVSWRAMERTEALFFPVNEYRRKPKSSKERFEEWWASTGCISGYQVALVAWKEAERQAANTSDKHCETCGEVIKGGE